MRQICKFEAKPSTINNGGIKKGKHIVWLNFNVSEIVNSNSDNEKYQSITERLVLPSNDIVGFLEAVSSEHLAMATNEEVLSIMKYFHAEGNLSDWKALRKKQIQGYDCSNNVNIFYFNDIAIWLDKATRVGLANSINIEKNAGRDVTSLWFETHNIVVNVDIALSILAQVELYALDCYNITAQHQLSITEAESIDFLRDFIISAGYPKQLRFSTE